MAGATITVTVNSEFPAWLASKVNYVMDASADAYVIEVRRRMMAGPASGRIYISKGRVHRASAPGQPPAPDTHDLVGHIATAGKGSGFQRTVDAGVSSATAAKYAIPLEVGTARVLPRPVWLPSLAAVQGRLGSFEY